MAENNTESRNSTEPKKTRTRKRTTAAGLVLSSVAKLVETISPAASLRTLAEHAVKQRQQIADSIAPLRLATEEYQRLLESVAMFETTELYQPAVHSPFEYRVPAFDNADTTPDAAAVDTGAPAGDRAPGKPRKQDTRGESAAGASPEDLGQVKSDSAPPWPTRADDPRLERIKNLEDRKIVARHNQGDTAGAIGEDIRLAAGTVYNRITTLRNEYPELVRYKRTKSREYKS